ncbi:MAG: alpha/beta hydrolase [bacterium]
MMSIETRDRVIEEHRSGGEFVEVEGLDIFYRSEGAGDVPLVLTHGIPRSSFLYRRMIPLLAEQHPVRAWDLYGFGLSDKPPDKKRYSFPEFERFFGRFLDALAIERAHLICHDVGGPFTIGFAVRNPERVASLTILNTTVFLKDFHIPGPVLASILVPMALQRAFMSDRRFGDMILGYMQRKAHKDPGALSGAEGEAWKELISREDGRLTLTRTLKAYRTVVPYLRGIRRALPGFNRPTLVLWGKHDPFCPLPIACRFVKHIPDARLQIISEASHFLQEDAPEAASRIILQFTANIE